VLTVLRKRLAHDDERGFTLIELMVVVLIIAILIAIAIPTFLGARDRAQDRSAQSNARNALTAAKTVYSDNQSYLPGTPPSAANLRTAMEDAAPELTYTDAASTNKDTVSVAATAQRVQVVVKSETGDCFSITDTATGATAGTVGPTNQGNTCTAA
jgi:type IV pilus assembly protein PilA